MNILTDDKKQGWDLCPDKMVKVLQTYDAERFATLVLHQRIWFTVRMVLGWGGVIVGVCYFLL